MKNQFQWLETKTEFREIRASKHGDELRYIDRVFGRGLTPAAPRKTSHPIADSSFLRDETGL